MMYRWGLCIRLASQDASDRPSQAIAPRLLLIAMTHSKFGVLAVLQKNKKAVYTQTTQNPFSKQASQIWRG